MPELLRIGSRRVSRSQLSFITATRARRMHSRGHKHIKNSRKYFVCTTARTWQLEWRFGSKVWFRKEAKKKASAPKWCQFKPPLVSFRTVPWVFCRYVTRKKAKDVTCSIQTLAKCSNAQIEKGIYSGSVTCTSSDLEKNSVFHFQPRRARDYLSQDIFTSS